MIRSRILTTALASAAMAAAIASLTGCSSASRELPATTRMTLPPQARLATAVLTNTPQAYLASGVVQAKQQATIAARVGGTVENLLVDLGNPVHRGQLLATLSAPEYGARLAQAHQQVESARDTANALDAAVRTARLQFAFAEDTQHRYDQLWQDHAISPHEYQQISTATAQARAALTQAQQQRQAAAAQGAAASAALAEASQWSNDRQVRAPFAGVVTSRPAHAGDLVNPGTPLFTIAAPGLLRVHADIPETLAAHLRVGQALLVSADTGNTTTTQQAQCRITALAPAVDPGTHTVAIRLAAPANLFPMGAYVTVTVPGPPQSAILVPRPAVLERDGLTQMLVLDERRQPQLRLVRAAPAINGELNVTAGLAAGERYVTNPGSVPHE